MTAHQESEYYTVGHGTVFDRVRHPWRPTDPGCEHVATVPIEPRVNADGIVSLRRCLYCRAEVPR